MVFFCLAAATILIAAIYNLCFLKETKLIEEPAIVEQTCLFPFDDELARVVVLTCSHGRISIRSEELWSNVKQGSELRIYYSTTVNIISGKIVGYNHYTDSSRKVGCIMYSGLTNKTY